MQIYLLRHGIAENGAPGRPDSERALTDEGREKLRRVLARARDAGASPSLILSSPYRRALETAEVAAGVLAYEGKVVKSRALVPEASPFDAWEEIRARPAERRPPAGQPRAADEYAGRISAEQSGAFRRYEEGGTGARGLRPHRAGAQGCAEMDADAGDGMRKR